MQPDTITIDGLTFRVELVIDADQTHPWEQEEGHGPVREASADYYTGVVKKAPGERVLIQSQGDAWLYDWSQAIRIASRDGWGVDEKAIAELTARRGRKPRAREIAAEAVRLDFERMRAWLEDRWYYVAVIVTLLDTDKRPLPTYQRSLFGIESDATDYIAEVAQDLAAKLSNSVPAGQFVEHVITTRHQVRA